MTNEKDSQLDDPQLSAMYKHTEQDMPPAHLDEIILNAAKQKTKPRPLNPFSYNWRIPASLAAVLIISFGLVTFMEVDMLPTSSIAPTFDESAPLFKQPIASIAESVQPKKEQLALRKKSAKPASEITDREKAITRIQQGLTAKQKSNESKRQLVRTMDDGTTIALSSAMPRLLSTPAEMLDIKSISTLRLAGNKTLANKQADKFIRHYFGNELNKVNPDEVKLSTTEWKAIINELRKLDHESIAIKLEKLLEKRLEN